MLGAIQRVVHEGVILGDIHPLWHRAIYALFYLRVIKRSNHKVSRLNKHVVESTGVLIMFMEKI